MNAAEGDVEEAGESPVVTSESVGRVEEGEPIGPSAADEAAMMGEDYTPPPSESAARAPVSGKLPSLDSLMAKIPEPTRRGLDEHLRARFMRVRKLKPGELR